MKNPSLSELRKESARAGRRLPRLVRWLVGTAVLVGLWAVAGFWVAPPVLRMQMEKRLSVELHRAVTVGKVRLNPFTLSVAVESLAVAEPGGGTFVGWRRLFVDFDALSLSVREWRFREITLDAFRGNISVDAGGRLNFADLLAQAAAEPASDKPGKKPWPLRISRLAVNEARLAYSDASRGEAFQTELGPTSVLLLNFNTGGPNQAPGEFSAVTETGETLVWRGGLSLAPLRSSGDFALGKIALRKYAPYYRDWVRFTVLGGRLDVAGHYEFALDQTGPDLRVTNASVALQSLLLAKRDAAGPVASLHQIEIAAIAADLKRRSVEIGRVAIAGGSIVVQRDKEGLDLIALLEPVASETPRTAPAPVPSASPGTPAGEAKIAEFSIRDLALTIDDFTTPRLVRHELVGLTFDLRNISTNALATPMPFGLRMDAGAGAMIRAVGTVAPLPVKLECALELTRLPLANLSPYVEGFANARIVRGTLTSAANLRFELPPNRAPVIAAQGDLTIAEFSVFDAGVADEMAGWSNFALKGLDYSSDPARLTVASIEWVDPVVHLLFNSEGALNLADALRPQRVTPMVSLPAASPVTEKRNAGAMFVALDHIGLENASVTFVDRSVQPNVATAIGQLSGAVDGLASSELARATVDLRGKIDGRAPVTIGGKINPLSAHTFTDLKMTMRAVDLLPLSPYLGKYAGYELADGTLTVDIKWRVAQRKVESTNVATFEQFNLGRPTGSPEATKLPVSLAVALLRDSAGCIVLDVPVQGRLDDPNFRVGRVVLRIITNLLTKAATSPFSLIGAMFGDGRGEELSFQRFEPGQTGLSEEAMAKLDVVAKALRERPTLRLEIEGAYDVAGDGPVLREQLLEKEMRHLVWLDRSLVEMGLTPEEVELDPVQKMGMVRRLYYKTFPGEAPRRRVAAARVEAPPPPVAGQRGNLGAFRRPEPAAESGLFPREAPPVELTDPAGPDEIPGSTPPTPGVAPLSLPAMKEKLLARIAVDEESYRPLAVARAEVVRDYLISRGEVPAERLSLINLPAEPPKAGGARVDLRLK